MRILKTLAAAVAALSIAAGFTAARAADIPESNDPIVVAINEWTGQHITSYIAGEILERMGYNIEYVTGSSYPTHLAVAENDMTLALEQWSTNIGEYLPGLIEEGKVEDFGDLGIDAFEGWMYPKHVEEQCPGLPDWNAFLGCADVFATAETFPKGRIVAYPAEWNTRIRDIIAKEGLPFEYVPAGSEGALVAELNASVLRKSPLIMEFWGPHWVMFKHDVGWLDLPDDIAEPWGYTKARVFKVGWSGTKDKWPAAYKFLKLYQLETKTQEELMEAIDVQGKDAREVCKKWVDENESKWRPWVDEAMM